MENIKQLLTSLIIILKNQEILQEIKNFQEELNKEIDRTINSDKNLNCEKGCYYCCVGWEVKANFSELFLILDTLNYLEKEKRIKIAEKLEEYKNLKNVENVPCPFLDESLCQIYEGRPFICRTFSSYDKNLCKSKITFEFPDIVEKALKNVKIPYEESITDELKPLFDTKTTIKNINFDGNYFYIDILDTLRFYTFKNIKPLKLARKYL
jgi:Fe-S-cluster containining protein